MDEVLRQVGRARRRLLLEQFLNRLVRCWFVALLGAAVGIAVPKLVYVEELPRWWNIGWIGCGLVLGTIVALGWTWLHRRSDADAAMEIDRRFGLNERVASSLSLPTDLADTPTGAALLADAARAVKRIDVKQRFGIHLGRAAWLPLGPAALALGLVFLVDNQEAKSSPDHAGKQLTREQRESTTNTLRKRQAELRKEAAKKGLKDAEQLLLEMDKELEKLAGKKDLDRKQALVKFNNLKKQLDERRQKLGGDNELKKQLAGMKGLNQGPADKMLDAMKGGDWEKAKQELDKLAAQLKEGTLDAAAREALQKQMEQLQQQLQQAAERQQQAMQQMQKQIEQKKQDGKLAEAGELQQKLDQLKQQQQQSKQMEQLAKQLGQCQECMKNGDQAGAAQAMDKMRQQLEAMQQEMQEGEMLDMAMEQLEMAKDSMNGQQSRGTQGSPQEGSAMASTQGSRPGKGFGTGRGGVGRQPEDAETKFRDSQVKQTPGKGAGIIVGEAEGPNLRGNVREEIKAEMAAQGSEPADPLVIEQLPKAQRENAEEYFIRLGEGE
jgi:hypothetical protein